MMAVISGNEMAKDPTGCWEEGQSLALCEKQCYCLGQRDEANTLVGQLQQRSAWILISCPCLYLRLIRFWRRQPSVKETLWKAKIFAIFLTGGLPQRQNYLLSPWTVKIWPKPYTVSMDKLRMEPLGKGYGWNPKCPSTSSCFKCLFLSWYHYFWWFWKFDGELLWKLPLAPGLPFSRFLSPDMWADHRKLSQPWTEMSFQDELKPSKLWAKIISLLLEFSVRYFGCRKAIITVNF